MKKYILDLRVVSNERPHSHYSLLRLTLPDAPLPPMLPGQFAQLQVDGAKNTFLRRPISIHYVDVEANEVWFLIQTVGEGTKTLAALQPGDTLNVVMPLGRGFSMPKQADERFLLIGGGVGTAPLLDLGRCMREAGFQPSFLLGARSAGDLFQIPLFEALGTVYCTTEDGSAGEKGYVTQHSVLQAEAFTHIRCCGPKPMMVAVARYARERGIDCEVSLENLMACGVGACLCCVEDTQEGHVCVCTEGPVFNINELKWQI